MPKPYPEQKAWGGRFSSGPDEMAERFTASIGFDQRLAEVDIRGSIAHAEMLGRCGIITEADSRTLVDGLGALLNEVREDRVEWDLSAEDIHMNVEARLGELIGPAAGAREAARAADILLRSGAFEVSVMPTLPSGRGTGSATWTRLASLAHLANAVLLALGSAASDELLYFASVRVETAIERVRWNGPSGHLGELAGFDVRAIVRKHKRAAPVGEALIRCDPFEDRPPLVDVRERTLATTPSCHPELVEGSG